ncbi:hypothetical protein ACHAPT_008341 [Fusarium lateritium]
MAWFKQVLTKAGEAVQQANQEYQRAKQQREGQQGQQGYQQQYHVGGSSPSTPGGSWQRQPQSPQYQQPQSPQYGQPQAQYQQQYQQPPPQPQQQYQQPQYQHVPPPPPYGQVSPPQEPQHSQDLAQVQAQIEAELQAAKAQAAQHQAEAEAQLQAAKAQAAQEQAQAQAQLEAAQAQALQDIEDSRAARDAAAQQLEAQWREAERLAAHYKAQYEAQMKSAEEDMARLRLESEQQQQQAQEELATLRAEEAKQQRQIQGDLASLMAEEARQQQRAEDEIVREQERLLDEIQRSKEEAVPPPLPGRPVSMVETSRPQSFHPPSQRNSYLSPLPGPPSHPPPSPSQAQYMPPPPPGPPPAQTTSPNRQSVYLSPTSGPTIQLSSDPSQQQTPYYPPPPPSPSQQQYNTFRPGQGQAAPPGQQSAFQSFSPAPGLPSDQPASPQQHQAPQYPPPPPSPSQQHHAQYSISQAEQPPAQQNTFQVSSSAPRIFLDQPSVNPSQQPAPYYPPPPPSPSQQSQPRYSSPLPPPIQTNQAQEGHRDSHLPPTSNQSVTNPSQAPYFPPPPPPSQTTQSPQQQPPASPHTTQPKQETSPARPKPPRIPTPELPKEHASGAKPLAECSSGLTSLPQHWFYHPEAPDFTICARCYVDHIYETRFRDSLAKMYSDDKEKRRCRFQSRRLKDTLFPEAIESGNLDECVAFMKRRRTIRDCLEQTQTEGDPWYTSSDIPHSTICPACFEDDISGTSFAKHYQLQTVQGACFCDSTAWFLKRKFSDYLKEDNWAKYAEEMSVRVTLPQCPRMNNIKGNDRQWYKPKNGPASLQTCVTCYFDYFYRSEDEDKFEQIRGGDFETRCNMGQLNRLIPMHQALADKDRSVFWKAAYAVDKYPFCHQDGIKGGTWYTLPGVTSGWGICAACYEGIIKPVGGSRWFVPDTDVSQDETYLCCFNMNHIRAQGSLQAYDDAHNSGDWKLLADYATRWANVRPCPRAKHNSGKNRPWWGWGVLAICEECYLEFAQGTSLEPRFALKGARESDNEKMCDLFSPRMRGLYTEACKTGDLQGLLAFAEQRHVIYTQTIMQCEQILVQQQIAAMQAQQLGIQGTFYKSMGGMQDAVMGHSYTVGNSYAGYGHANEWMLQGHVYDRQASEMRSQVGGGSILQVAMLEARWKEVE